MERDVSMRVPKAIIYTKPYLIKKPIASTSSQSEYKACRNNLKRLRTDEGGWQ